MSSVKELLLKLYVWVRDLFGFSDSEMKIVIVLAIFGTGVIAYMLNERNKRRKKAATVRDFVRQMKDAVVRAVESLDSRTQWVFQDDDDLAPAKRVYKKLTDLEEKMDWNLVGRYEMRKDEIDEAMALLTKWVETKPNYDTKAEFLRDMAKAEDILKRW
jgi:acyl-CoA synthetase (AMP-forming)/AMP-acid ligase II